MGGQACVFYGAAEFSRDTDFAVLADEERPSKADDRDYWEPLLRELERLRHGK